MRHRANQEGGATINEHPGSIKAFAGGLLLAMVLTGCGTKDQPPENVEPFGDFSVDCQPVGWQKVPYKRSTNDLPGLAQHIKTSASDGAWNEHPCYDEAYTYAQQATSRDYPYDGAATLPKFLVPEGMTLRQVKNQQ